MQLIERRNGRYLPLTGKPYAWTGGVSAGLMHFHTASTSPESLKEAVLTAGEEHGVTGRTVGLPLFESLEVLGKDRALARIDGALAMLAD